VGDKIIDLTEGSFQHENSRVIPVSVAASGFSGHCDKFSGVLGNGISVFNMKQAY
jgi:hypothetical protein